MTQTGKIMNKPKSTAERQRALRERLKAQGLVPFQLWVKPEHKAKIKEFAESLDK